MAFPYAPGEPDGATMETWAHLADQTHNRHAAAEKARSPTKTLLTFAAVLVPLALAPYLLTRRQIIGLTREFEALRSANSAVVREVRAARIELENGRTVLNGRIFEKLKDIQKEQTDQRALLERVGTETSVQKVMGAVKDAQRAAGDDAARLMNTLESGAGERREETTSNRIWRAETTELVRRLQRQKDERCAFSVDDLPSRQAFTIVKYGRQDDPR